MEKNDKLGWVKIHRKLLENPLCKSPQWGWVWICLLLMANHEDTSFIWNGEKINLKSGEFLTGRKKLASIAGVSEGLIEKILNYLEMEQQIRQQKSTKWRIITILNWDKYQERDSKSNNSVTTTRQQRDTYKNEKNEKKLNTIPSSKEEEKCNTNPMRMADFKPEWMKRPNRSESHLPSLAAENI